jgi:hypothetical protein
MRRGHVGVDRGSADAGEAPARAPRHVVRGRRRELGRGWRREDVPRGNDPPGFGRASHAV